MNVLILGSGAREHALAWSLSQSPLLDKLYILPGNAGTKLHGENITPNCQINFDYISQIITDKIIDLLVVGSEDSLVGGIRDFLLSRSEHSNLLIIGPGSLGSQLEGSKLYAKEFMQRHSIPCAKYFCATKDNIELAINFLSSMSSPYVLKADGLASGKGVVILSDLDSAILELKNILSGKFGKAGDKVLIEEYLHGIECSAFVLTDLDNYLILPEAKDYKRIGEGDTGLNTGGMGAVSPVPFYDNIFAKKVEEKIIKPTITGLKKDKTDYIGFIFFGLMNVKGEPYVIEYNVRLGDPESEVIIPRIKTDLLHLLILTAQKKLTNIQIDIDNQAAATIVLVSGGYPEDYEKGKEITGLNQINDSLVFHAGTRQENDLILTNGGRVLAITSLDADIFKASLKSYKNIELINFDKMYYRKDISKDLK